KNHHKTRRPQKGAAGHKRHSSKKSRHSAAAAPKPESTVSTPTAPAVSVPPELAGVRQAIDLVRKSKIGEATIVKQTIDDGAARKLVEWFTLRHPNCESNFA